MRISAWFIISFLTFILGISCENEPYEGPLDFNNNAAYCDIITDQIDGVAQAFYNSNADHYTQLCNDYLNALQTQLQYCVANAYEIQALIDILGDCTNSSFFKVDFDGQTLFASDASAHIGDDRITISGFRDTVGDEVILEFFETTTGTFQLGANAIQPNTATYFNANEVWTSVDGTGQAQGQVTLSHIDMENLTITGTFNFTGHQNGETKAFTNGVFNQIAFTKSNQFFAKVDGVEFVDTQIVPGINNFGFIGLLAITGSGEKIFIATDYNVTPGTYNFSPFNQGTPRFGYSPSFEDFHYAEGTLTIEIHNRQRNFLKGKFECTATPYLTGVGTYQITEGEFCVTYLDGSFDED